MGAETNKIDLVCFGVKPYQKKISFDMTFEMTGIVSGKPVRTVLIRNRLFVFQFF